MVKDAFSIPRDFQSRPEFRRLETEAGFSHACAAMFVLWRELAYLCECQRLGFITKQQVDRIIEKEFKAADAATPFESGPVAALVRAGALIECADGYECRVFQAYNEHLASTHVNGSAKGGFMSKLKASRRKFEREASEQEASFNRAIFCRSNGSLMDDDEMRRVLMLVKILDNIYARAPRPPSEFSHGIIADAYNALTKHNEPIINGVCFWLSRKKLRWEAKLPMRTEEALREFDHLAATYGRSGLRMRLQSIEPSYGKRKK